MPSKAHGVDIDQVIRTPGKASANRVILALRQYGTLSRAEIAQRTGLARSTVSEIVSDLVASGLIVTQETRRSGSQGRPSVGLSLDPHAGAWIGIDFGMRRVRAVLVDVSHSIQATHELEVGLDYPLERGLEAAGEVVDSVLAQAGTPRDRVMAIGAAVPAPIDPGGGTVLGTSMIPTWTDAAIASELSTCLGQEVLVDNDSNCAALAEHAWGAGRGFADIAYVKLHSGTGGAVIVADELVRGIAGTAGEFGHITMDEGGPLCRCGGRGCLETYVGIPALLDQLRPLKGDDISFSRVVELAQTGDPACLRVVREAAGVVGRAAANVATILGPEAIIVGGALATIGEPLMTPLSESFRRHSLAGRQGREPRVRVVRGELGRHASALGAVVLLMSRLGLAGEPG